LSKGQKNADLGYEKRQVATLKIGVAQNQYFGKISTGIHRGIKKVGYENYVPGKGLRDFTLQYAEF
jgi:hypothetical protein